MNDDTKVRLGGGVMIGISALLFKIAFLDVLADARRGAGHVSTSMKGLVVAPGFLLLGILLVLMGAPQGRPGRVASWFVDGHGPTSRLKPLGWVAVGIVLAPGFGLYVWLQDQLSALGYR
jgi:hypothetical protein